MVLIAHHWCGEASAFKHAVRQRTPTNRSSPNNKCRSVWSVRQPRLRERRRELNRRLKKSASDMFAMLPKLYNHLERVSARPQGYPHSIRSDRSVWLML